MTRYLLDEFGQPDIPFGAAARPAARTRHPFPDDWRAVADKGYGLDITPKAEAGVPHDAVEVIRAAVDGEPERAHDRDARAPHEPRGRLRGRPDPARRIAGIHAMLGTIEAPATSSWVAMT